MRRHFRLAAVLLCLGLLVAAGAASVSASSDGTYVVQPGDSLWALARAHGLTVDQLAAANHMNPNDILLIGRHLYIPSQAPSPAPGSGATGSGSNANPWTFCSTFTPDGGPWGVEPELLSQSPDRLALRPLFVEWANHYDLSLPLLEAIAWQESGWQQNVVSSTGAIGAGQIMPGTAAFISTVLIGQPMNIHSVSDNIRMSAAFLAYLAHVEGNSPCKTIAAYYEGPLNMGQYGVFSETQAYVASVEALIPRFS
jgi:hypothetical protein